jgi:sulfide:quinone oxidoreductase
MKRIVVLGGGVGGTIVANLLARRLRRDEAEVTLVDLHGRHVYQPAFLYVAFGAMDPRKVDRDERRLLSRKVRLVLGEATRVDASKREVQLSDGRTVGYDRLVIALGARLAPEELPGMDKAALHFYSLPAAMRMYDALDHFDGGRIVVTVAGVPYKCPPAPAESACQLDYFFRRRGMRDKVDIHFLSPISRVFPLEPVNPVVEDLFARHGIRSTVFFNVESIDAVAKTVTSLEGESVPYDLLVMIPPHRGATVVEASGLGDRGGWLPVDRHSLRVKDHPDIFGIGDCTDLPVSKSGSAAHFQARVVVDSILADLRPGTAAGRYDGKVVCYFDAGYHKAMAMSFDYEHPPKRPRPGLKDWIMKRVLNRAYWTLVPTARV